ncbi:undecaprenyl/decaprenyl-phosphate alpha-N-acetylglucosaminyl 1-phosphate transferase [Caldibacillus lycopersici]|uniref:Undecaprenyl/decaprenyl-phosphate alpha-N-acetylglucosaminyl 1-phosphate transferase n=1 Tax=Perspicuibacillus lycopersici TaxID=1325689 RepID=A0AAE3IT59_9BACI|nr:MraY family glycosyltransferase [Perspicuibacillus lycopersici]MCU9612996.1 undecaprenyl/decaprenyl-phosphate alpha-N-acetylglucosaminyl 1-phosphate transferase [Perspicuibacillus lycopersici]
MLYVYVILTFLVSFIITPFIIKLSKKLGIVDKPNERKVHSRDLPLLGGLAIFISFLIGVLAVSPDHVVHYSLLLGSLVIIVIGIIDDKYEIRASTKFIGQLVAAGIVIFFGDVQVGYINLPFGGVLDFGFLSIPITFLWIIGVTNAINLIDGLDGLSAGVSAIALIAIAGMAFIMNDIYVLTIAVLLVGSILGFLPYNFHPAKIFMGDTGALFLGFMIAVLSLLGFKNITFISFIVPILILGVPLSDTIFAIIRRIVNKKPFFAPDKAHLHHCLLKLGFSHRQTVILIYSISAMFAMFAFIFSMTTLWGSILLITIVLLLIELMIEKIGLIGEQYKPILRLIENIRYSITRNR